MKTILLTIIILSAAVILLAMRVLFVKGGMFRGTCSGNNSVLKEKGVKCSCGGHGEDCKNK